MIVRDYPSIWKLFFIRHGSIVPMIRYQLIGVFTLALIVTLINIFFPGLFQAINLSYFAMVGLALSLFLSFRNNTAYERWWEGRNIWGQLVKESRSIPRTLRSVLDEHQHQETLEKIERYIICFPIALRHQCQKTRMDDDIMSRLNPEEYNAILNKINPANLLLLQISRQIGDLYQSGLISDIVYNTLDEKLSNMNLIQAGCERLNKTPIPFAYNLLLQRTAMIYCVLLPFGLVTHASWATAPLTLFIAYTFFGLDALARDLEDPFSKCPNSLPLNAICISIERIVLEMQGQPKKVMPPLPKIKNYVLS